MKCSNVEKKLIFYLEGDLSPAENQQVSQHIATCSDCAARLSYMKTFLQQIDIEKSADIKPFLYTRIQGRMTQAPQVAKRRALVPLTLMTVLLIGILVGTLVGKTTVIKSPTTTVAEYDVSSLFNDSQMESMEYKLLSN